MGLATSEVLLTALLAPAAFRLLPARL